MSTYNFDKVIDRRGTGALKLEALQPRYGDAHLLPLWVADMDFETPHFITDALRRRLEHSLFGYTVEPPDYRPTIIRWINEHHHWDVRPEWLAYIPGIVKGIGMAINVFLRPDEKVVIQPPVYHPFRLTPKGNDREVVYNPLLPLEDGRYAMDLDGLDRLLDADPKCRMLLLSNPHNPAGIVWSPETLRRLADICHRRGVLVISDEIHADMPLYGHRHTPFATVSDAAAACSITFGAPSKTFNIAGIVSSYAIVPNDTLRRRFYRWLSANELDEPTLFAPIATIAAYRYGEPWRRAMLSYVEANIDYLIDYCACHLPAIRPLRPEASFLVWLDCRDLNLDHDALIALFVRRAHLALNDGEMFGPGGEGYMRINVGTPRAILSEALERLRRAVDGQ